MIGKEHNPTPGNWRLSQPCGGEDADMRRCYIEAYTNVSASVPSTVVALVTNADGRMAENAALLVKAKEMHALLQRVVQWNALREKAMAPLEQMDRIYAEAKSLLAEIEAEQCGITTHLLPPSLS